MRPDVNPEWANIELTEIKDVANNGVLVSLKNKEEPSQLWKDNGQLYRTPVPYQYINYILDNLSKWVVHLNEGDVGDIKFELASVTEADMNTKYGNTWTEEGTDTVGSVAIKVFKRTA